MLYPVYLHFGDDKHAHGVTIPDFPGCFSAADNWEELPRVIQESAEVYFEGEEMAIPAPTPIELLARDPSFEGGAWMLADIDLSRINSSGSALPGVSASSTLEGRSTEEFQHVVLEAVEQYQSKGEVPVEIALPKDLLTRVDEFAKAHHASRSAVIARAVEKLVAE